MTPTRIRTLAGLAVAVAAITWLVLRIADGRGTVLPTLTWTAPAGVLVLGVVVGICWITVRRRDPRRDLVRPIAPLGMARMAVLGKASAHVGAALVGCYLGWVVLLLPDVEIDSRRERALVSAAAGLSAVLLAVAGLLLERACRVRDTEDDPPGTPADV